MFDKILRLGKETMIYGLSTIMGRLLNFLIVPFYANVLLPAENGAIANIYAYIAFAFVLYGFGMEQAFMRFVSSLEVGDKKQNFSMPFLSLCITSILFSILIHFNAPAIANMLGLAPGETKYIQYAAWILCFDSLAIVPFALLRMEHKAKMFVALKLVNITCNLILNIILIIGFGMHAEGVFLANLLASALTILVMSGIIARNLTLIPNFKLFKELLKFGIPYIPVGFSGIAMQVVDRPIVKALTDDATLGIYQLNYRLGIFMMLIVGMFDYAWRPFFLNHAKDPDSKQLFAKVFTFYSIGATLIFLTVSCFIEDLIRISIFGKQFFPPIYWQGVEIVPWILLAYVFTGAYVVFVVGVYLEKKTKYLPLLSAAGALINIFANFALIPRIGILGAALSTLLSYIVMATGMYFASQHFYRVEYEWRKVGRILISTAGIFILFKLIHPEPLSGVGLVLKLSMIILFLTSLVIMKVIDRNEISGIKKFLTRLAGQEKNSSSTG
jgi:O-antigen/teichoic acid export membrane protein